ncbi:hypothetical protein GCM10028808_29990 [Spirosoma migulaei]
MTLAAHLLKLPTTKKAREQYVDMLNRTLAYIGDMLYQLTDYARIEAGKDLGYPLV